MSQTAKGDGINAGSDYLGDGVEGNPARGFGLAAALAQRYAFAHGVC